MYCSACGVAVGQGLSYCNYCGAKLSGAGDNAGESSEARPGFLVFAMMATFVFGLVAITMLMGTMKVILGFSLAPIVAFTLLSFLIMLLLEGVFISQLHGKRVTRATGEALPSKGHATKELDAAQARGLPEPIPSVTEHTTRTFDPVYNERTSK